MSSSSNPVQQPDLASLKAFHSVHFPGQPIPELATQKLDLATETEAASKANENQSDLGYYPDNVKRTLTDQQIQMFRHSEIQRLLSEKRALREVDQPRKSDKEGDSQSRPRDPTKRRFHDEPSTELPGVDTLTYDEPPAEYATAIPGEKKFLWPLLGQKK